MHKLTKEILEAIQADESETIIPASYSWAFRSRSHTSAAFRKARGLGIIEVAYVSAAGTPVYRKVDKG